MPKLTDLTLIQFTDVLASDAPAPGGGSTAALEGALGIALTNMVANLTIGKKKYAEHETLMAALSKESIELLHKLTDVINRDTEAFDAVSAVFAMPKETEEDKAARREAMQAALKGSTLTPFEMMTYSLAALRVTKQMLGKSNSNAISDLGVAALSLKAAVQGAWLNILINIGGINDQAFADKYRKEGEAILAEALPLADQIYNEVLTSL